MEKKGGLSLAEREMIVVATSGANGCLYCVVAHGAVLRIRAKNPLIADQVATNYRKADINDREKAMLDFAMKVCEDGSRVSESDFTSLHAHGFSDEDIWVRSSNVRYCCSHAGHCYNTVYSPSL